MDNSDDFLNYNCTSIPPILCELQCTSFSNYSFLKCKNLIWRKIISSICCNTANSLYINLYITLILNSTSRNNLGVKLENKLLMWRNSIEKVQQLKTCPSRFISTSVYIRSHLRIQNNFGHIDSWVNQKQYTYYIEHTYTYHIEYLFCQYHLGIRGELKDTCCLDKLTFHSLMKRMLTYMHRYSSHSEHIDRKW